MVWGDIRRERISLKRTQKSPTQTAAVIPTSHSKGGEYLIELWTYKTPSHGCSAEQNFSMASKRIGAGVAHY